MWKSLLLVPFTMGLDVSFHSSGMTALLAENGMTTSAIDTLKTHGCHCAQWSAAYNPGTLALGQQRKDQMDDVCRVWIRNRARCIRSDICKTEYPDMKPNVWENTDEPSFIAMTYSFDAGTSTCSDSDNACQQKICNIDKYFAEKVADFAINHWSGTAEVITAQDQCDFIVYAPESFTQQVSGTQATGLTYSHAGDPNWGTNGYHTGAHKCDVRKRNLGAARGYRKKRAAETTVRHHMRKAGCVLAEPQK